MIQSSVIVGCALALAPVVLIAKTGRWEVLRLKLLLLMVSFGAAAYVIYWSYSIAEDWAEWVLSSLPPDFDANQVAARRRGGAALFLLYVFSQVPMITQVIAGVIMLGDIVQTVVVGRNYRLHRKLKMLGDPALLKAVTDCLDQARAVDTGRCN